MAENTSSRRYNPADKLDVEQILAEAQNRWLRPPEICEILQNYRKYQIAPSPPDTPPSGSLFLFDRKILRYFRKDGHNWRKKKDGKTVKEAHEKLKAGSIDVLHCYYAHGEDNENFQRRCYWMLEEDYMHIVLVHYLEVKGNRTSFGFPGSKTVSPVSSNCLRSPTDSTSLASAQTSDYDEIESAESRQPSSTYQPFYEVPQSNILENQIDPGLFNSYFPVTSTSNHHDFSQTANAGMNFIPLTQEQIALGMDNSYVPKWSVEQTTHYISAPEPFAGHNEQKGVHVLEGDLQNRLSDAELGGILKSFLENDLPVDGTVNYPSMPKKKPLLEKSRTDSFNRWMSKELGEVNDSHTKSSFYWDSTESENVVNNANIPPQLNLDAYLLSPSVAQDQLFSITDFSPNWGYTNSESKVIITGTFLKSQQDLGNCRWSCMFGETEVLAEVLGDGVLRCQAPLHLAGRVPFYITCSNRLACSEVREFEFRESNVQDLDMTDHYTSIMSDMYHHVRFGKLLSLKIDSKVSSLMKEEEDEWFQMIKSTSEEDFFPGKQKEQRLQKMLKEKLHVWLLQKVTEGEKGPTVLDEEGQGVLHLAAALGYDWAIEPTISSGVSINFRDVNGWTALHWAAFCGRERTVGVLVSLGAAPGALSDPSPKFPSGRTPADLASANGHKGIAGYLAECSLTTHLSTLALKERKENDLRETSDVTAVQTLSERSPTPNTVGIPDVSLKDSLTALCNANQAAARIHQVFRVQSFQKKQLIEINDDKVNMSDERALSLVTMKSNKSGRYDEPVTAAAVRIQNKFRGWKGRKDFLVTRQRIVRIQAHVRGHQVRKHYKSIVWSVGIVEKVILRWRRKGRGLRGFRDEALPEAPSSSLTTKEDDDDFLKAGRKQTEERLDKALSRVKSMVRYPEARDQYRRLLTVVTEIQESKAMNDWDQNTAVEPVGGGYDDLIDLEALLDDDTFMSTLQ
ncbi:calmodulin-binding transcription activator 2-like isoform X1 [Papaver somniferum]|uniref:calmodulin-binding transcription activator 2-like isoform X1 n=1 Tax=Papaver somniferum TaxID=3469 RepID=UPI000E6FA6F1|nr:calmodulin-binding transcription activator 2-like isoform X1 [Papaver somniferum]